METVHALKKSGNNMFLNIFLPLSVFPVLTLETSNGPFLLKVEKMGAKLFPKKNLNSVVLIPDHAARLHKSQIIRKYRQSTLE